MKKLSILIALCLLVTVGGVYATWVYGSQPIASASRTQNIQMGVLGTETEMGVITPTFINGAKITVEDEGGYKSGIETEGDLLVTFKPAPGSSAAAGIDAVYSVEWVGDNTYLDPKGATVTIFNKIKVENVPLALKTDSNSDGAFDETVSVAALVAHLEFTKPVVETLEEYNALNAVLVRGHFVVTVSHKIP